MWVQCGEQIDESTRQDVLNLADTATGRDQVAPLSEQTTLNLDEPGTGITHIVAREQNRPDLGAQIDPQSESPTLLGYAQIDARPGGPPSAELVVHPDHRGRGIGRTILRQVLDHTPDARIWVHGSHPAADALARSEGLTVVRELLRMGRQLLPEDELPAELPEGYTARTFTPADGEAWLAVNAAAFVDHAEQGRLGPDDLQARLREEWFDPQGFFLVHDPHGRLAAFHWTKVHDGVAEVYVVGVSPEHQGKGLGRAATAIGLAHLRDRGHPQVELYVDGHNTAAVNTYRKQRFTVLGRDVQLIKTMPR
ncbi:mycothiol synthase [Austwickia chelonae]|uniref:Mycothiol acetyltransferase n=1 Tax=Austwickia chelonae NBRC 105200 TaxID=1184607 RepID=K6V6E0_9MICO|nr:mycothiol synthase [Austwickia chelonae]GAB77808.1 acetyltransferase MshD [Austwickia chelonae NBRC 105200]SEV89911.1 mycothiol synthase [Austwickia chelonae]